MCLDRAHLCDRSLNGLDGPQNLVPLCERCHKAMPSFNDGHLALEWVFARETRMGAMWRLVENSPWLQAALEEGDQIEDVEERMEHFLQLAHKTVKLL